MALLVTPENSKKENTNHLNVKFSSLKLRQKAESVEVLDKGPTNNIFTIYCFKYSSKTSTVFSHPNILFAFAPSDLLSS